MKFIMAFVTTVFVCSQSLSAMFSPVIAEASMARYVAGERAYDEVIARHQRENPVSGNPSTSVAPSQVASDSPAVSQSVAVGSPTPPSLPRGSNKSLEHVLNLLKCSFHLPSTVIGTMKDVKLHHAIYYSQVSALLKIIHDRLRSREWDSGTYRDFRVLKQLAYLWYVVDCYKFLNKIDLREEGTVVLFPSQKPFAQSFLLALEVGLHFLFFLNDTSVINISALRRFDAEVRLELLDLLELLRLYLKMQHHGTVEFSNPVATDNDLAQDEQLIDISSNLIFSDGAKQEELTVA